MDLGNSDFLPIVLGTDVNTYGIARSMYEAYGVRTLALGRAPLLASMNSQIVDVRAYADFDDPAAIVRRLEDIAAEFPGRARLLIATVEFYTNVLIAHQDQLRAHFIVPVVPADLAARLMNKTDFYRTCAELGVPYPATAIATRDSLDDPTYGEHFDFPYPVILKPSDTDQYPRLHFEGRQKIYLIHTASELRAIAARIYAAGYTDDLIIQEYLTGDESVMRVVNTYSDRHGRMRFCSAGQIVLGVWDPTLVGNYNAVITMNDPELTDSIRTFLDSVGYVGAANFDVMYDVRTGTSKLLEVNLRQGGASFYTMAAGGNQARCYVEDLVYGRDLDDTVVRDERLWVNVPYPLVRFLAPKALRARVRAARKHGVTSTLWYRKDRSRQRVVMVARYYTSKALQYARFAKVRIQG